MSNKFTINAESRNDLGKGASRRLRRLESKVPAVLYGIEKEPTSITLALNEFTKALEDEAFYSHILTLVLDGTEEKVVLKDLQRHPAKGYAMHADFLRIDTTHKIHMHVPIHFINEDVCHGSKMEGGQISHQMTNVEVVCLAKDLPEYFEIDMTDVHAGTVLHLSDITIPEGVEIPELEQGDSHNHPVVSVTIPKGVSDSEDGDDAAPAEEASSSE